MFKFLKNIMNRGKVNLTNDAYSLLRILKTDIKKDPNIIPKKTTNIFKLYIKYKEDINEKPITLCTFAPQKQNRSFQFQVL